LEDAILVANGHGEAIHFGLTAKGEGLVSIQLFLEPVIETLELFFRKGIVEGGHGNTVAKW
jgi:hypothetical protein